MENKINSLLQQRKFILDFNMLEGTVSDAHTDSFKKRKRLLLEYWYTINRVAPRLNNLFLEIAVACRLLAYKTLRTLMPPTEILLTCSAKGK